MKYDRLERNSYNTGEKDQNSIEDMLLKDEKILWRGKPKKSAFVFESVVGMLPFALLWLIFDTTFIVAFLSDNGMPTGFRIFFFIFMAFHLLPVWIWLSKVISAKKKYENMDYCVTDKRIIIRSGFFGVSFSNIFYKDVSNVRVTVGFSDKLFHVGDIHISSLNGKDSDDLSNSIIDIENPYDVLNLIQKTVSDIQADISYPNALRPNENNGYNTKYNPDFVSGSGKFEDKDK